MSPNHLPPRAHRLTAVNGVMALVIIVLLVQMWLLTATLEEFLAGHREMAVPAAILSGLLFAGCFALHLFVNRIDRESRQSD